MVLNLLVLSIAGFVPLIVGMGWYSQMAFGRINKELNNMPPEGIKINLPLTFFLTYLMGFFLAVMLNVIVIHQNGVFSTLANDPSLADPNSEISLYFKDFMAKHGTNFRTFKHGAFHGVLSGIFFALPVISVLAMFEGKSWKYIFINAGYWTVSAAIMGGIICQWS